MNTSPVTRSSSPAEKIALFRSLFRGREDVYARRFESRKTGRGGYQPACANEWVRGICEKPRIKCMECPNRRFLPVTDEAIQWHLSGKDADGQSFVMGMYPMLRDESCFFLAVDFDRENWGKDAGAFVGTCRRWELPAVLERSRSGSGGHVWLFFNEAIPAMLARKLGSAILTESMERRPELGFASYDRFFPNQDTLPKGGLGNVIALPLQKQARDLGNSVFLDEAGKPHEDQWVFLSAVKSLDRASVEARVTEAEKRGRVLGVRWVPDDEDLAETPWLLPPSRHVQVAPILDALPPVVEVVLSDQVYIPKDGLPPALRNRLLRLAAFQNPEFYRAQAMRLPTYDKPRIIHCAEDHARHIALPRGCLEETLAVLKALKIKVAIEDERVDGAALRSSPPFVFHGELRPEQKAAAEAMLAHDTGVLAATTAFGKTVLAAWLIAQRGVSTLVLVHRRQLLDQWVERLAAFLGVPAKTIGIIGGGRRKPTGRLDVAIIQSLVRKGVVNDGVANYGFVIVDECHHVSAHSFELVARRAKARYFTGLSATVTRKDGHHPIIFMQCGPVRYRVDARKQAVARPFSHHVLVRPTGFRPTQDIPDDQRIAFQQLYSELIGHEARNRMIRDDVVASVAEGRHPLVLTERTEHLRLLEELLVKAEMRVMVLQGGMGKKVRMEAGRQLADEAGAQGSVILATGKYVGEGFDVARLDTLFLVLPVSWRGTIAQYAGRLHRLHDGKREVRIYDYADLDVAMLSRMFDRRCRGYEAIGYTILLPASALPGWPPDVPLPVDPEWKHDYAASVRRLIRDGVDTPLAHLFVLATRPPEVEATGEQRARSASEAFLFRRLQTLPDTKDHFVLNAEVGIPFDGWGKMEVDFLGEEFRLVIELDGDQHLSDPEAYRRDRRKDVLLQQNGYLVVRYLAQDVSKHLDRVLDGILAAMDFCRRRKDSGATAEKSAPSVRGYSGEGVC
jgi:superfamily II DNA or RNA helicase